MSTQWTFPATIKPLSTHSTTTAPPTRQHLRNTSIRQLHIPHPHPRPPLKQNRQHAVKKSITTRATTVAGIRREGQELQKRVQDLIAQLHPPDNNEEIPRPLAPLPPKSQRQDKSEKIPNPTKFSSKQAELPSFLLQLCTKLISDADLLLN